MGSIDVHTHFIPQVYLDALTRIGMSAEQFGFPVIPWDMNKRLQVMEDNDIDVEMLSISSEPGLHYWPQHEAIDLVKKLNDELAEIIRANPKRFGGYTTLPLPYIDAALAELARGYDELGIDGVGAAAVRPTRLGVRSSTGSSSMRSNGGYWHRSACANYSPACSTCPPSGTSRAKPNSATSAPRRREPRQQ